MTDRHDGISSQPLRIFLIAGEPSGDSHGGALAKRLLARDPTIQLEGVGGPHMAAAGVRLHEDLDLLKNTAMGLLPVIARLPFFMGRIRDTAAALGPWIGALSATAGVLLSSLLLFMIGRLLGHKRLQAVLGTRALRVQHRIVGRGVVAVAMIRMVPIAPFTLVNVLAGASELRLSDFLIGTLLGMAPGIVTMALLCAQIADFARHASWSNALPLALTIVLWITVCLAVQFVVTWITGRRK